MDDAKDIRTNLHPNYDNAADVTGNYLGGTTGAILDERDSFEGQFNQILPLVALGVGIVLFFVLGSLILPVFAILSVLMSIVWTLAATILVFQVSLQLWLAVHDAADPLRATAGLRHGLQHIHPNPHT